MVSEALGRAPGRVNLIGEHTDYNAGLCLPLAIDRSATVHARRRDDDHVEIVSRQRSAAWRGTVAACGPGEVAGWPTYVAGVLWALRRAGWPVPGLDLHLDSEVPIGAGLSSSAAVGAATAMAVCGVLGQPVTDAVRDELVEICRQAETEVAGAPTGGLDQSAVLRSVEGCALLLDFSSGERRAVSLDLAAAGLQLLVTDTGVTHDHATGGYAARRRECEAAAAALGVVHLSVADADQLDRLDDEVLRCRARHVLTENERVRETVAAIEIADWPAVGALMSASHASLRDDFAVTCPELDVTVAAATAAGALGSRMTGGGFGGATVTLVTHARVETVVSGIDSAFVDAGWEVPRHLVVAPAGPAEVI